MPKQTLSDKLKSRAAENAATENDDTDVLGYKSMAGIPAHNQVIMEVPVERFVKFFSADIGFRPQTEEEFNGLIKSIEDNGLIEEVIARPVPDSDLLEIIAGEHRVEAHRFLQRQVRTKIVTASTERAILIATETNLKRRESISPIEKGYAYKAQIDVLKQQGKKIVLPDDEKALYEGKKLTTRLRVALLNGVDENKVWRCVRLTYLIAPFREILMSTKNKLPVDVGIKLSYYDEAAQEVICRLCYEEKLHPLDMKAADYLREECPAPSASEDSIRKALTELKGSKKAPVKTFKITRSRFEPYLIKIGTAEVFENLLLELLEERFGVLQ